MYTKELLDFLTSEVEQLKKAGRFKNELSLTSAQGPRVKVGDREVLMFASNNYLGLAAHPQIVAAAKSSLDHFGFGLSSVRFISGTTVLHQELEKAAADFLEIEDAILFSSCFAANEAFFAALFTPLGGEEQKPSVIYTDELNHASIIDGLKLVRGSHLVKRIYPHNNPVELEKMLAEDATTPYQFKVIATDGVFSMEGELAQLPRLAGLSKKFQALLFVDDSHGLGVCGKTGRGSAEELGVLGEIDVFSGTFSKALGGAGGGFLAGKKELIDFLRQKARPYTFSNSLSTTIVQGSLAAIKLLKEQPDLLIKLKDNTLYFREKIKAAGFKIIEGNHPIVPIMTYDAAITQKMSQELLKRGLYVVGLWFPVVPEGQARLRIQISAAHLRTDLDQAIEILTAVGQELKIIK
ncbi:MAG: glycine C-acetyltransferase [Candidatus Komeilibacteria bacterium RIFCSPLOWO2_01_FULL_45_10]|uniref:Glycine C-acetyltransferase n=1 Tax=Candidatus Komeilibacteria bacterium RIFCSPLOWO2_01_FULL_45_10 TaxID=1798550 RepID=A0A1G2BK81_9BACT|nr:MAG: glycine C-acetyltransferase [Candidatus Komeilibacteria bacterium RIFCSPLOWO2_01_FULL_45_10]